MSSPDKHVTLSDIRQICQALDIRPTKKLGQNFVHDHGTLQRIVATAQLPPASHVLEVGPGLGSLTLALLKGGHRVTACEIDPVLANALPNTVAARLPEAMERLHVICADAARLTPETCMWMPAVDKGVSAARRRLFPPVILRAQFDSEQMEQFLGAGDAPTTTASLTDARPAAPAWAQAENSTEIQTVTPVTSGNARVASQKPDAFFLPAQPTTPASLVDTHLPEYLVANLPYNVAVPVLLHLLSALPSLRRVVVMVQREVGERLCASPGSKTYGIPSAKIAWWGQARMAGLVSRQVFWPVPHVDSVLVSLDVSQRAGLRAATFEVIDHSFAMRRKTLRANLKRWLPDSDIDAIAADAGVSLQARAESLDINDFHLLARVIARKHCDTAVAKAPGKVNLALRCGAKDARGYHPLVSVFQSVNLWETVRVTPADSWSLDMTMTDDKGQALELPQELQDMPIDTNLAVRGVKALLAYCGLPHTCAHISIDKRVPIAGGMAGGSADAAAALVAANAAFGLAVTEIELHRIARQLGADVPNALTGGNALGLGYGDHMFRLECAHTCWWVFATAHTGLSTPAVFSAYDAHTRGADAVCTSDTDRHIAADEGSGLILGNLVDCHDTDHEPFMLDSSCLPGCVALPHPALRLHNDLHETACRLRPELREVCAIATRAGALDAIVSGSGPTVACLCASESGAHDVAKTLAKTTYIAHTYVTYGPVQGAHLVETAQPPAQNTETD